MSIISSSYEIPAKDLRQSRRAGVLKELDLTEIQQENGEVAQFVYYNFNLYECESVIESAEEFSLKFACFDFKKRDSHNKVDKTRARLTAHCIILYFDELDNAQEYKEVVDYYLKQPNVAKELLKLFKEGDKNEYFEFINEAMEKIYSDDEFYNLFISSIGDEQLTIF